MKEGVLSFIIFLLNVARCGMDYKFLMIDDDEVIAQSTAEYFNMFDIKTTYVNSYEEAVDFLEKNRVSLLLLDINLGDKSGFDLCKKV